MGFPEDTVGCKRSISNLNRVTSAISQLEDVKLQHVRPWAEIKDVGFTKGHFFEPSSDVLGDASVDGHDRLQELPLLEQVRLILETQAQSCGRFIPSKHDASLHSHRTSWLPTKNKCFLDHLDPIFWSSYWVLHDLPIPLPSPTGPGLIGHLWSDLGMAPLAAKQLLRDWHAPRATRGLDAPCRRIQCWWGCLIRYPHFQASSFFPTERDQMWPKFVFFRTFRTVFVPKIKPLKFWDNFWILGS